MHKTIFFICLMILNATVILDESANIWLRILCLILLVVLSWLDGAVRESERNLKFFKELNDAVKKLVD